MEDLIYFLLLMYRPFPEFHWTMWTDQLSQLSIKAELDEDKQYRLCGSTEAAVSKVSISHLRALWEHCLPPL